MKFKLAVMIGIVATVLTACATQYPAGTIAYGGIFSPYGKIYTVEEFFSEFPDAKQYFEKNDIDTRGKFIKFSANKHYFGGTDVNYAYVPPNLAHQIKKDDIVKVIGGDRAGRGNVVAEVNPPGCKWDGGGLVLSHVIYCNGKESMAILPNQQQK